MTLGIFFIPFFILIMLAYSIGAGIPLLVISYGSQKLIMQSKLISKYTEGIQKIFGVIMILTAIAIYTGFDKTLSLALLNKFPQLSSAV